MDNEKLMTARIRDFDPGPADDDRAERQKEASVMIPLIYKDDGWHLLFEVRALDIDVQPGEICFPGGGVEEGEDGREAALRETGEELLIPRSSIELIREEPPFSGAAGIVVYAYVGVLKDYGYTFSKDEVDHVFTLPVSWLVDNPPKGYPVVVTSTPGEDFPYNRIPMGRSYPWRRRVNEVLFYPDIPGEPVFWGLTAKITSRFIERYKGVLLP